jgi:hypothetical protein
VLRAMRDRGEAMRAEWSAYLDKYEQTGEL